MSVHY